MRTTNTHRSASWIKALLALVFVALVPGTAAAQPFNCLPSCDPTDARFLVIVNGAGFKTLSDPTLDLTFIVPAGTASFEIGIFDGDILSGVLPDLHWDTGNPGVAGFPIPEFSFTVFADPDFDTSGTLPVAGPFIGSSFLNPANEMPDNDWFDITITTGPEAQTANGDYVYRLRIELDDPTALAANSFKVRTSAIAVLEPIAQPFGYVAQRTTPADEAIIYPGGFPGASTYDGFFTFFIEATQAQTTFSVWDGDFDRGDFDGANSDTDDPNTPGAPFEPTWATGDTVPEAVAVGDPGSTGSPSDDKAADPNLDLFLRQPSVRYDLIAPDSTTYSNEDPSGNQEWEEFRVSTIPGDPNADVIATSLPAGAYTLDIEGVDLANFNFLLTPSRILCADENGQACPPPSQKQRFLIGDTVFEDPNGDGVQQGGESGIPGVIVDLVVGGNIIDSTVTDANGNYNFLVSPDETYTVVVSSENFAPMSGVGAIGDTVWYDIDGDGVEEAGEPGLSNVTLQLFLDGGDGLTDGVDDTLIEITNTDADGFYFFNDLADGNYWVNVVDFTVPSGLSLSGGTDPSSIVAIAGNVVDTVDFGYTNGDPLTAVVGNYVWIDANGNGIQDVGEAGINDVTLSLIDDGSGTVVAETRTTADGSYLFTGVAPGTYRIDVTDTAGILASNGLVLTTTGAGAPDQDSNADPTAAFSVAAGEMNLTFDFGYVNAALADISDTVWFDANRNGLLDGGEMGLSGVTVKLTSGRGDVVASTITNAAGEFTFPDLPDGPYTIEITDLDDVLNGLLPTTTASVRGFQEVTLAGVDIFGVNFGWVDTGALEGYAGTTDDGDGDVDSHTDTVVDADILDYDFGYRGTGSIGDRVWEDVNGDGGQAGESGINGVTVELLRDGVVIDSQLTSGDGNYLFENLPPGDYTVRVVPPAGFDQTFDITPPLDNEASVSLGPGENRTDVDFGYRALASIGDRVWYDLNGDGVQDPAEVGINDVTVRLFDSGGGLVDTQTTAGDGEYLFSDLQPGTYTVVVDASTLPAGFQQTFDITGPLDNEAEVTINAGDAPRNVDFGYVDECLPDIDFETDALGASLAAGTVIDDEFAAFGITVSTNDASKPAMIFDSANPTGGDPDLGTPNETFGGPGIGVGGEAGEPGENAVPLGKVLIISEDGDSSDPDDNAGGGTLIFDFAYDVRIDQVGILDIDEGMGGTVKAFDDGGAMVGAVGMANNLGSNSVQTVTMGVNGVRRLEVQFPGSGAVSGLTFCVEDSTCLPTIDFEADTTGASLTAGTIITDQFAGVTVTTNNPVGNPAMIFNSASPTGGDHDLGTPNQAFGGPGVGTGGASGLGANTVAQGNVLIISEDGDTSDPDDNAAGGTITFTFAVPVFTASVGILDIDGPEAMGTVRAFDAEVGGNELGVALMEPLGDNSVQRLALPGSGVRRLEVWFPGSGAVTDIVFCEDEKSCVPKRVRDDFETASFSNNDGPDNWAGDWIEDDPESGGAGPNAGQVRVVGGFLRLDDYPNTGGHPSAARQVDLSDALNATLRFDFDTSSGVDYDDAVTVEISSDGGANYTTLEVITNITGATWQARSYDITAFASAQTRVRFRVSNKYGGSNEYFWIGFVEIDSSCGECRDKEIKDLFEVQSYSNNDGADSWSGDWIEFDPQGGGPVSGQVAIHDGLLTLDDYPNTGTQPSAEREFDIAGAASATLSFEFLTSSGVDTSDAITVEISPDGGATWSTLEVITGISGAVTQSRSFDITAFATSQTRVRFRVSSYYGGSYEVFCVSFIKIETTCPTGPEDFTLDVTKSGAGSGTVGSNVGAIDCGPTCSDTYADGTVVTLTATPDAGSTFVGWSGDCSGAGAVTNVTVDANKTCNAEFDAAPPEEFTLDVTTSGSGTGTVTSAPGAINCGATCSDTYTDGTVVALTATADAGSTFVGWSGDCAGAASPTNVTVDANKTCDAQFDLLPPEEFTLGVTKSGSGTGTVTSAPGAINCGATCSDTYTDGTVVTLTATPDAGSTFVGWSGDCAGAVSPTNVTVDANKTCDAQFDLLPPPEFTLDVTKSGSGTGTVTSAPGAINCGATCSDTYTDGTVVTLTATPDAGSTFVGWSGDCAGAVSPTNVTVDANKTCDAQFDLEQTATCPCDVTTGWTPSPFLGIQWTNFRNGLFNAPDTTCTGDNGTDTILLTETPSDGNVLTAGVTPTTCTASNGPNAGTKSITAAEAVACRAELATAAANAGLACSP